MGKSWGKYKTSWWRLDVFTHVPVVNQAFSKSENRENHMLRKTVIARALTIAFGTAVVMAGAIQPAMAQSNASGIIFGTVESPAGTSITMTNTETGLKRSISADASGRYSATNIPA